MKALLLDVMPTDSLTVIPSEARNLCDNECEFEISFTEIPRCASLARDDNQNSAAHCPLHLALCPLLSAR